MRKVLTAVVAVAVVAMGGIAMAANTNVEVRAQVVGTCRISSAAPDMNFGVLLIDAAGAAQSKTMFGNLEFWCTKNSTFNITDDNGENEDEIGGNRMKSTTLTEPEYIAYTFSYNPISGAGGGVNAPVTLTFEAEVGPTFGDNSPDVYRDVVRVEITP